LALIHLEAVKADAEEKRVSIEPSTKLLFAIDEMRIQIGARTRRQVVEMLLNEFFFGADESQ